MKQLALFDVPAATTPAVPADAEPFTCKCGAPAYLLKRWSAFIPLPHAAPCGESCVRGGATPPRVCWGVDHPDVPCKACASIVKRP